MPYRCRDCRKFFSVKTKTLMHGSKLGLQTWAIAYYLVATGIKGVSSMKLYRDLGITRKSAWFLAHRIRETWANHQPGYTGPIEVDETWIGGPETRPTLPPLTLFRFSLPWLASGNSKSRFADSECSG